jgi:hypothetical protein
MTSTKKGGKASEDPTRTSTPAPESTVPRHPRKRALPLMEMLLMTLGVPWRQRRRKGRKAKASSTLVEVNSRRESLRLRLVLLLKILVPRWELLPPRTSGLNRLVVRRRGRRPMPGVWKNPVHPLKRLQPGAEVPRTYRTNLLIFWVTTMKPKEKTSKPKLLTLLKNGVYQDNRPNLTERICWTR